MSAFIYYDETAQEVKVLPEAMELHECSELYASDHTPGKTLWKMWIKYVYYVYKKDGVFSGDLLTAKRREICNRYFPEKSPDYFEKNYKINAMIKLFMEKQYTTWERLLEKWKEDVDQYIIYLTDVPYQREIKPDKDGDPPLMIPNIKEKKEAQMAIQDLVETGRKIEENILQEKKQKSGKLSPLFDN